MVILNGTGVSPGIAIGKVLLIKESEGSIRRKNITLVEDEVKRLQSAIDAAKGELVNLFLHAERNIGQKEASILLGHLLMLEDMDLIGYMEEEIRTGKINAEWAVENTRDYYVSLFLSMRTDLMKERATDVKDIANRILGSLIGKRDTKLQAMASITEEAVIAAKELAPSDALQMDTKKVKGILLEVGGKTSHTVIIARSLGIPAVVGIAQLTEQIRTGDTAAFDGQDNTIYINPDVEILQAIKARQIESISVKNRLFVLKGAASQTKDGRKVEIAANIGSLKDLESALENGADGVGLFRTEFLFLDGSPTEQEQFEIYKTAAEKMGDKPVIIRTLDIGGDKAADWMNLPNEDNPSLGYRAIRLCLDQPDLFKTQLRAILRASVYGNIKIMFPMISSIDELRQAKELLQKARNELIIEYDAKKERNSDNIEVGIMIETPSAALMSDRLAKEADFFSIGTNDLIQYTMAADRLNEKVSGLFSIYQPAVLRLIQMTVENAHKHGISVGICGEAAREEKLVPLWIGMGLDKLSVNPGSILPVKEIILNTGYDEAQKMVSKALDCTTDKEVTELLQQMPSQLTLFFAAEQ